MKIPQADVFWRSSVPPLFFHPLLREWKMSQTALTEDSARPVRWRLLCCGFVLVFCRRRLLCRRWPFWGLAVLSLCPWVISSCRAFALSLISLTLWSFLLLGALFNPGYSEVFAVCGSPAAFLDVFSCLPLWFLCGFGRDEKRRWRTWLDVGCFVDKVRENKKGFVRQCVFKVVHWIQGLGIMSENVDE